MLTQFVDSPGVLCAECSYSGYVSSLTAECVCVSSNLNPANACQLATGPQFTERNYTLLYHDAMCECFMDYEFGYWKLSDTPDTSRIFLDAGEETYFKFGLPYAPVCNECFSPLYGPKPNTVTVNDATNVTEACNKLGSTDPNSQRTPAPTQAYEFEEVGELATQRRRSLDGEVTDLALFDGTWSLCSGHGRWDDELKACVCYTGWGLAEIGLSPDPNFDVLYSCRVCKGPWGPPVSTRVQGPFCYTPWTPDPAPNSPTSGALLPCSGHGEYIQGECHCYSNATHGHWTLGLYWMLENTVYPLGADQYQVSIENYTVLTCIVCAQNYSIASDCLDTTSEPTKAPTTSPTKQPTASPTKEPTTSPTLSPSAGPTTAPTLSPSTSPTLSPSASPSTSPTLSPSAGPTTSPSAGPTTTPTTSPSAGPSTSPTLSPSAGPTTSPSAGPTTSPSAGPTTTPTLSPSTSPSTSPSAGPTTTPTLSPSAGPTTSPSAGPTTEPTQAPTPPTSSPTSPTQSPTPPTSSPTSPTSSPTSPTQSPTLEPVIILYSDLTGYTGNMGPTPRRNAYCGNTPSPSPGTSLPSVIPTRPPQCIAGTHRMLVATSTPVSPTYPANPRSWYPTTKKVYGRSKATGYISKVQDSWPELFVPQRSLAGCPASGTFSQTTYSSMYTALQYAVGAAGLSPRGPWTGFDYDGTYCTTGNCVNWSSGTTGTGICGWQINQQGMSYWRTGGANCACNTANYNLCLCEAPAESVTVAPATPPDNSVTFFGGPWLNLQGMNDRALGDFYCRRAGIESYNMQCDRIKAFAGFNSAEDPEYWVSLYGLDGTSTVNGFKDGAFVTTTGLWTTIVPPTPSPYNSGKVIFSGSNTWITMGLYGAAETYGGYTLMTALDHNGRALTAMTGATTPPVTAPYTACSNWAVFANTNNQATSGSTTYGLMTVSNMGTITQGPATFTPCGYGNQGRTACACINTPSLSPTPAPTLTPATRKITLFVPASVAGLGNLFADADLMCGMVATSHDMTCAYTPIVTCGAIQNLVDWPTVYGFDASTPVYTAIDDVLIASSWTNFWGGSWTNSLSTSTVWFPFGASPEYWWTGCAASTGTYTASTCFNWSSGSVARSGTVGSVASTTTTAIEASTQTCDISARRVCACLNPSLSTPAPTTPAPTPPTSSPTTSAPTQAPTPPTSSPTTGAPTQAPTLPTSSPTTGTPTQAPTPPTQSPTPPTSSPTPPTSSPTTGTPTQAPTPPTQSPTQAPTIATKIYFYKSPTASNGNLGDRAATDAACNNDAELGSDIFSRCRAVTSVLCYQGDPPADYPMKFSFPPSTPIYSKTGALVSSAWSKAFGNTNPGLDDTLMDAEVFDVAHIDDEWGFWSGLSFFGRCASEDIGTANCDEWTTGTLYNPYPVTARGVIGDTLITNVNWATGNGYGTCEQLYYYVCMCVQGVPSPQPGTKVPSLPTKSPTSPTLAPTTAAPTPPTSSPTPPTQSPTPPTSSPTTKSPTPSTSSPTTQSPTTQSPTIATKMYLYVSPTTYTGALGSRSTTDGYCNDNTELGPTVFADCRVVTSLVSYDGDPVIDFPRKHSFPPTIVAYGKTGTVVGTWSTMFSGSGTVLTNSLSTASVTALNPWTGTDSVGRYTPLYNCLGWTTGSGSYFGRGGRGIDTGTTWIEFNTPVCSNTKVIVCACIQGVPTPQPGTNAPSLPTSSPVPVAGR